MSKVDFKGGSVSAATCGEHHQADYMNVLTEASSRPTTAASAPAQRYIPYPIFALCASLYFFPIMRLLFVGSDEGTLVYGAVRVARGQVFARDFFEVVGPGTFYWLALFFKLFGITFAATRICLFFTSLGTALTIYFLTRRVCRKFRPLPCIMLFGLSFGAAWPGISHHTDSNFFALLSVACLVKWQDTRKASLLLAAGILTGVTMSIHWPKGLLLIAAILLWLLIECRWQSTSLAAIGQVLAGFCAVIAVVLGFFWSQGALWDLIYANFVWPSRHYGAVNSVPYAQGIIKDYWNQWAIGEKVISWSNGIAAILITPFLFVAALPVILLITGARQKWNPVKRDILLYWLCGWALWLSEFHRRDIYHLVLGAPLLIVLAVYLLGERREPIAALALQTLAVTATCLCCLNWLLVVIAAHPMMTRVGAVAMYKPDITLKFLDEHVSSGDEIFSYPYCPMYYFLSGATNPTRYSFLMYNYNTASQFRDAIDTLDRRRTRYVVWNTTFQTKVAGTVFPASVSIPPDQQIMEPYLNSHYKLVKEENGIRIMERKSEDHPD